MGAFLYSILAQTPTPWPTHHFIPTRTLTPTPFMSPLSHNVVDIAQAASAAPDVAVWLAALLLIVAAVAIVAWSRER